MTPSTELPLSIQTQLSLSKVQAHIFRLQEPIHSRVSPSSCPFATVRLNCLVPLVSCHDTLTRPPCSALLCEGAATTHNFYHCTSPKTITDSVTVLPNNVNKTSLHPTGVTYVFHNTQSAAQAGRFTNTGLTVLIRSTLS